MTFTQTAIAQPMGTYTPTAIDQNKATVDFRLVSLNYIRWNDGKGQQVTKRELKKLQAIHTWTTDF